MMKDANFDNLIYWQPQVIDSPRKDAKLRFKVRVLATRLEEMAINRIQFTE